MQKHVALLLLAGGTALGGCGASSNSAPIVYGTSPNSTARVYNSPADVYMEAPPTVASVSARETTEPRRDSTPPPVRTASLETSAMPALTSSRPRTVSEMGEARPRPIFVASAPAQSDYVATRAPQALYVSETEPVSSPLSATEEAERVSGSSTLSGGRTVRVARGDTVYAISRRAGVSPRDVIAVNDLDPPYTLSVGQTLRLPERRTAEVKVRNVNSDAPAPRVQKTRASSVRVHVVRRGDTLYSIARANGMSVAEVARANGLRAPYQLSIGDRLQLTPGGGLRTVSAPEPTKSSSGPQRVAYAKPKKTVDIPSPASMFAWPVRGAVIGEFGDRSGGKRNDGINIAAPVGAAVRAAADGEVVYRGDEVDGYGNLLLIKHKDDFVTAYAHNDVILVRRGQKVSQGQVVAKVGQTGEASEPQLHFEIRQNLKSVNPLTLLTQ